jgi:tetratricopeptide (TPR) repeat protein
VAYEGTVVSERFEIVSLTGEGGMGMVYRARDRSSNQFAALKILRADTKSTHRDRFAREARLLAKLEHPSIVKYLAHGITTRNEPFLAMEWLDGEDLSSRLKHGSVSPSETLRIIHHAANALGVAHRSGVVHRDIKPSNLFLVEGDVDRVKVLDFGIAHIQAATDAMTRTGSAIGTPGYMAPEQARGSRDIDARADVFSLGCVMFECLAGKPPFAGDTSMAVLAKILLEDAPRLGKVCTNPPAALEELVGRMLEKDPANRPRDCSQVAAALETIGDVSSLEMVPKGRDSAVSIGEQRLVCVVVAGDVVFGPDRPITHETRADTPRSLSRETAASAHTVAAERDNSNQMLVALSAAVAAFGGRAEVMADGSVVVSVFGQGAATDQAARAARCALAVRRILPDASMALAIGRSADNRLRLGDLIDRAAVLVASPVAAREPAMRPIRVDEVAAGLLDVRFGIEGDDDGLVLVGERDIADHVRTLLGKPMPCVGRERELATLQALFADCVSEPMAHIVMITGAPGIGKSRLRYEVMTQLAAQDVEVWIGSGDPMSVGAPFTMLAQALRRAAGIVDGEALAVRHKKLHARVLRHVQPADAPRIVEFLGELVGAPLPDEESMQLRAARQDPQLMGDQMLRACEDFVAAECSARPLALILEDLQWGDLPTVRFVDSIVRQLEDRPLFIVALARPDVDTLFPRLWSDRRVVRIHLGELTKRAGEKLACQALGKQPGDPLIGRLVEGAAGNPFYLEELIRAFAEGRGEKLPGSVLAMAQARIEGLELEARQVLRAASIFGPVFWRGPVIQLLEGGTTRVEDWLQELVRRELIVERRQSRFAGEVELAFRHGLIREAAYAMLTEADRVKGHRHAGRWLEDRIRSDENVRASEADAVILAEHFERGGDPRRSTTWYQQAAQQALEGDDLIAAIDRAERAVQCVAATVHTTADDRELVGELRQLQAAAHLWRGDFELAISRGKDAIDRLRSREGTRGDRGATERWLVAVATVADACSRQLDYPTVIELSKALVEVEVTPATCRSYTYAVAMAATAALWCADAGLIAKLYARLDAIEADPESSPAALAWIHSAKSWRAMRDGDLAQCVVFDQKMVDCFTEVGDLRHACQQRGNLGYDELMLGSFARAERSLRETIATATRHGLHQITAQAQHNLGLALAYQGRLDEGREVEKQALALFVGQGNRKLDAAARAYLAVIETMAGNYPLAIRYANEAIALTADAPGLRCQSHAAKSIACRLAGEHAKALDEAVLAMRIIEEHGRPEEGDADARLAYAEALHATGAIAQATQVIADAEVQLRAVAAKILDPDGQRSFLASPTHARTLELAAAWQSLG